MSPDDPQPLAGPDQRPAGGSRERPPSRAAQARLSGALRDRADAYRQDASIDLTIVEALLRLDEAEAAAKTLDEHRASLHAMARDLQVAVADAAVEREAEFVCEAVAEELRLPLPRAATGLRRRVLAVTGAAAVVVALVLPTARFSPRTTLASFDNLSASSGIAAARERLEVARSWASALRADATATEAARSTTADAPRRAATVARQVRSILAADTSGGSAASSASPPADVTDLAAYREARSGGSAAASQPPAEEPTPPADEIQLPDVGEQVPRGRVPLGGDAELDVEGELDSLVTETDTDLP